MMELPQYRDIETIFEICIDEAKKSPCPKRKFGAVLVKDGEILGIECNRFVPGMEFICQDRCIRLNMPSGVDSMVGSCGHAEEWLIYEALKNGINIEGSDIYVAGILGDGTYLKKSEPAFYCMRCAMAMLRVGISGVFVPKIEGGWHYLSSNDAIQSAYNFAIGKEHA